MQKEEITITCGVPIMWTSILEVPGVENADFSSLQFCMSGGASQPVAIMKKMLETFHLPITEGYGLSEAICCSSMLPAGYLLEKTGSIGWPFLHNMMRVVNKAGEDVRPGERRY